MELHPDFAIIQQQARNAVRKKRLALTTRVIAAIFFIFLFVITSAPKKFPVGVILTIPESSTKREVAHLLKEQKVIKSETLFYLITRIITWRRPVLAGDYQFEQKKNIIGVIRAVNRGIFGNVQLRITLFEGSTIKEMAETMQENLPQFDGEKFKALAYGKEGYLFPDTYLFFRSVTPETLLETLTSQYEKIMAPLREQITKQGKTEEEIIIMASLIQKEALTAEEARVISGILWKRIKIGMPLQVDAPFLYVLGKTSAQLTTADLQKDGPYNTYTRKGLPVGPITNPGFDAIYAAINPVDSPYLFYLHDRNGNIYYARTHDEHVANKQRYLR